MNQTMGTSTFISHALPGSFFLVFALWWTLQAYRRHFQCLRKTGENFLCSVTFPCSCLCGRLKTWQCEGFVKVILATAGLIGEIVTGFNGGKFTSMVNGQHATMFLFFGLSGVVDILVHHRVPLPKDTDYAMLTLSFVVEALMFHSLKGSAEMDILVHNLLLYAVYGNVLACLLEMRFRRNVLSVLGRAYLVFVQGTWLWQMAFILDNPRNNVTPWYDDDDDQKSLVSMMFAWHMGGVFFTMLVMGAVIGCVYRCRGDFDYTAYNTLQMQLIKKDANGQTVINLHDDSDSDIEFERPLQIGSGH